MNHSSDGHSYPPFRPTLDGCVGRDIRLANLLMESYVGQLYAIAAYTYRSLMVEKLDHALSAIFDEIATDVVEHFRLLGDLVLALGGNPMIRTQLRVDPIDGRRDESPQGNRAVLRMLSDSLHEEKRTIDRYQTVMGQTQDRVVRSVLSQILSDKERHVSRLKAVMP